MEIGFLGIGNMGEPMAANLLRAGHAVRVYNRTASKADGLVAQGATLAATPADAAVPGGIVCSILANDQALEDVCAPAAGLIERLGPGGVHLSMSTVSPDTTRRLAEAHAARGAALLGAPVFGRPEAARAARLWVCVSGAAGAKARIAPLLESLSQGTFDFGEDPGAANVAKIGGNFLIASAIEALAEALTLVEKNGVDRAQFADMIGRTLFAAPIYQGYGRLIAEHRYEPVGFRLVLGLKDINLALQAAPAASMPLPLGSLLRDQWLTSIARGRADHDWASVGLTAAEDAGLKPLR